MYYYGCIKYCCVLHGLLQMNQDQNLFTLSFMFMNDSSVFLFDYLLIVAQCQISFSAALFFFFLFGLCGA